MVQDSLPDPRRRKDVTQYYTSTDYHDAYKAGRITPLAVAEALLTLIERPSGKHSVAFLDSKRDLVLTAAGASTDRYKQGNDLGILDGVPVCVKDEVDLAGYKRTLGIRTTTQAAVLEALLTLWLVVCVRLRLVTMVEGVFACRHLSAACMV